MKIAEKEKNTKAILEIASEKDISCVEAALEFAEQEGIKPERLPRTITSSMVERIRYEFESWR